MHLTFHAGTMEKIGHFTSFGWGEVNRLCQNNSAAALQDFFENDIVWSLMETQQRPRCEGRSKLMEERVDFLRKYLFSFFFCKLWMRWTSWDGWEEITSGLRGGMLVWDVQPGSQSHHKPPLWLKGKFCFPIHSSLVTPNAWVFSNQAILQFLVDTNWVSCHLTPFWYSLPGGSIDPTGKGLSLIRLPLMQMPMASLHHLYFWPTGYELVVPWPGSIICQNCS